MAGCNPILVDTGGDYLPDPERVAAAVTERTRAVVTVSPNNPTGAVYPHSILSAINEICRRHGIYHISDEAYEDFIFEDIPHFSPGSISDYSGHTISLFSLSKAYGFAGWRIGYMVTPPHLLDAIKKIQDTLLICPPLASQAAALGALQAGRLYVGKKIRPIAKMRSLLLERLKELDSHIDPPLSQGAFYVLLRLHTEMDDLTLVKLLIEQYGVAVIPGSAFGIINGCYLRIAYAALEEKVAVKGIDRLIRGLKGLI